MWTQQDLNKAIDEGIVLFRGISSEADMKLEIRKIKRRVGEPTRTKDIGTKDGNLNRSATLIGQYSMLFTSVGYCIINPDPNDVKLVCHKDFGSAFGKKTIIKSPKDNKINQDLDIQKQLFQLKELVSKRKANKCNEVILDVKNIDLICLSMNAPSYFSEIRYTPSEKLDLAKNYQRQANETGKEVQIAMYDFNQKYPTIMTNAQLERYVREYELFVSSLTPMVKKNFDTVKTCLDNSSGMAFEMQQGNGYTLLHMATDLNDPKLVKILLEKSPSRVLEMQDIAGNTPLHMATYLNNPELVKILLEKSPSHVLKIQNASGNTPLDLAIKANKPELIKMLLEKSTLSQRRGIRNDIQDSGFLLDNRKSQDQLKKESNNFREKMLGKKSGGLTRDKQ